MPFQSHSFSYPAPFHENKTGNLLGITGIPSEQIKGAPEDQSRKKNSAQIYYAQKFRWFRRNNVFGLTFFDIIRFAKEWQIDVGLRQKSPLLGVFV